MATAARRAGTHRARRRATAAAPRSRGCDRAAARSRPRRPLPARPGAAGRRGRQRGRRRRSARRVARRRTWSASRRCARRSCSSRRSNAGGARGAARSALRSSASGLVRSEVGAAAVLWAATRGASAGARWSIGSRRRSCWSAPRCARRRAPRGVAIRAAAPPRTSSRSSRPRARACARRAGPIPSSATRAASGAGCAGACRGRCSRSRPARSCSWATPTCGSTRAGCSRASTRGPHGGVAGSRPRGVSALCREAFARGRGARPALRRRRQRAAARALYEQPRLPAPRHPAHDPLHLGAKGTVLDVLAESSGTTSRGVSSRPRRGTLRTVPFRTRLPAFQHLEAKPMGLLDGKVAIVTGAGGGLGREHALALSDEGAAVVVNDLGGARDGTGAGHTMADAGGRRDQGRGGEAVANYDDVATHRRAAQGILKTALDAFGRVDVARQQRRHPARQVAREHGRGRCGTSWCRCT